MTAATRRTVGVRRQGTRLLDQPLMVLAAVSPAASSAPSHNGAAFHDSPGRAQFGGTTSRRGASP